nr:ribonuclease H-like domain-containing protein [Tanacetum cinerariifolium]
RKNKLKAKSTLLLAIPDEHLLKFHSINDAKSLWEAIKIWFGGNKESKKMHQTILKQQYENLIASRSKGLDKTYDRFQNLISQLELNGEVISHEDANMKLLRSLPLAWNNIALIIRNKPGIETLSMDDLYNNLKVAMITMMVMIFMKNTERNLNFNGKEPVGFDKTRAECYNCHISGHFARECHAPRNQAAFDSSVIKIDEDNNQAKDRYKVGIGYHAVSPPYTGNYMPPRANLSFTGLDDSVFNFEISETRISVNENESIASKSSKEIREEPKTVRSSAPIIEDWESDFKDECEDKTSTEQDKSSNDNSVKSIKCTKQYISKKHTNNLDENLRKRQDSRVDWNDCTFYENKMVEKSMINNKGKGTGQRKVRPVWNNARRVNHQNFSKMTHPRSKRNFVPTAVATKSGHVLVNAAKQSSAASTRTTKPKGKNVTTAEPKAVVNAAEGKKKNAIKSLACWI